MTRRRSHPLSSVSSEALATARKLTRSRLLAFGRDDVNVSALARRLSPEAVAKLKDRDLSHPASDLLLGYPDMTDDDLEHWSQIT